MPHPLVQQPSVNHIRSPRVSGPRQTAKQTITETESAWSVPLPGTLTVGWWGCFVLPTRPVLAGARTSHLKVLMDLYPNQAPTGRRKIVNSLAVRGPKQRETVTKWGGTDWYPECSQEALLPPERPARGRAL